MGKVVIIAEAGVNHNGSIEAARKLIDVAVEAGVDYVKFQTFSAEKLVSKNAKKAKYQIENTNNNDESQFQMLKNLELSIDDHYELIDYCKHKGVKFFSTAFDLESLKFLANIGLKLVKIPSGELTNLPYLRLASQLFEEFIISTGMADMDDIGKALQVFKNSNISSERITILHCNTEYPTPMKDVNLLAMIQIEKVFKTKVGYSDHTMGIEVPIAAVALGATVIEKHFTLDRTLPGPDHLASLEPNELKLMVQSIRNIEEAISGDGIKKPSESEKKNIEIARKSIVAKVDIQINEEFTEANIDVKRPGNGISPMLWDDVIGKKAKRNFSQDDLIEL